MVLYPKEEFNKVSDINLQFLKKNEIKALILDLDNTLIDYYKNLNQETIKWVNNLKNEGIKLYILSNSNKEEKVKKIAQELEIPYKCFAKKPLKRSFWQVKDELKQESKNIAVVGDQIFTDILGGNRCNMFTILVEPIEKKDIWITEIKRPIENFIKNKYRKEKQKKEKNNVLQ